MKNLSLTSLISIFLLSFQSPVGAQTSDTTSIGIDSPVIKEAIIACLSTAPKNTDNQISHKLVKKCLEAKGFEPKKTTVVPTLSPLMKEKRNEALKQCSLSIKPNDPKSLESCLKSKGIQ